MLGHDLDSLRIGGIHALVNLALEHADEYQGKVVRLLQVSYKLEEPMSPAEHKFRATMDDAFLTILGEEKGQALLRQFDQMRLRNSRNK